MTPARRLEDRTVCVRIIDLIAMSLTYGVAGIVFIYAGRGAAGAAMFGSVLALLGVVICAKLTGFMNRKR